MIWEHLNNEQRILEFWIFNDFGEFRVQLFIKI